jgi:Secretion system C-terminal sorting domain
MTLFISFFIKNSFLFSQTLVAFDFAGENIASTTNVNTNLVSPVSMARGDGISASSSVVTNRYYSRFWTLNTTSLISDEYIEFNIIPKSNISITITGLKIQHERSATGPNQFLVRSSYDNFLSDIATFSLSGTDPVINNLSFSLQDITSQLTIRIYGYGATHSQGAWGPGGASGNDIELLGSVTSTLPTEMIDFRCKRIKNIINIKWRTASEINASHFSIERSTDGKMFNEIGQEKAKGSNSEYEFDDNNPKPDVNYYRLKMVDLDGSFEHSKIISVLGENSAFKITPSVVTDFINIETPDYQEDINIQILDLMGRVLKNIQAKGGQNRVDVFDLRKGIYILRTTRNGRVSTQKLMKS